MRSRNLCLSTWGRSREYLVDVQGVPPDHVHREPTGYWFVDAAHCEGVLPLMLAALMAERKRIKGLMEAAKAVSPRTPELEQLIKMLDAWQTAVKVSTNAVYGACGAQSGSLWCLPVAATTTAMGRFYIKAVQRFAEVPGQFDDLGFGPVRLRVLNGDTDSLFMELEFADDTVERAHALGAKMVAKINGHGLYAKPMAIAAECLYWPYLFKKPKMYAARRWEAGVDEPKTKEAGSVTKRRDNAKFVSRVNGQFIATLMRVAAHDRAGGIAQATQIVRQANSDLLNDRVSLADLTITMRLSKRPAAYKNPNTTHLRVVKLWAEARPGDEPKVGDRVPFVVVRTREEVDTRKEAKVADKARPPFMVTWTPPAAAAVGGGEASAPVAPEQTTWRERPDGEFYVQKKLRYPIESVLSMLVPQAECDALFDIRNYDRVVFSSIHKRTIQLHDRRRVKRVRGGDGGDDDEAPDE
jgi:DNA polymerase elongation subunit (family B)